MSIKRDKNKTKNFTILSNSIFQDPSISAKAKGLYAYLMTLPDDWTIHKTQLHKMFKDGKASIATAFEELADKGFITSEKVRDDQGRIIETNHTVYESPTDFRKSVTDFRKTEIGKPEIGKSDTTKDYTILKTDTTKDSCTKPSLARERNSYSESFDAWWKTYKRSGSSKLKAYAAWKTHKLEGQHEMMIRKTAEYKASLDSLKYMKHAERFITHGLYESEFDRYEDKTSKTPNKPKLYNQKVVNPDGTHTYY